MFKKFTFSQRQINNYYKTALRDFGIARESAISEVIFKFSYDALIKLAIAICAKNGLRVKAMAGHHIKLIEKLSKFMDDKDIENTGNKMRIKRNSDLYDGGVLISEKEAAEYINWLKSVFLKAEVYLSGVSKLL